MIQPKFNPSLRRIRAVVAVANAGGAMRAAEQLCLSQSSVTRAVRELELDLGQALFERHRSGMLPTAAGNIVIPRFVRALKQLESAEEEITNILAGNKPKRLAQKLSHRQLEILIAIAESHNEPQAALSLGLTQPAISASLRDLERQTGTPLFLRTKRGMVATDCGEILIRHAKLAMREIALTSDDLAAWQGHIKGHIVIGTLPLSSSLLVPLAIDYLRQQLPDLHVTILDGTYDALLDSLSCGDIDLLIGALRPPSSKEDIIQEPLFSDCLAAVVHRDHPLAQREIVTFSDLKGAEWIAPRYGTPARRCFEQGFIDAGLMPPDITIETGNLSTIRTLLLLKSERVTLVSPYQFYFELQSNQLVMLPIELQSTRRQIGITVRKDTLPTKALSKLRELLFKISKEFKINDELQAAGNI